MAVRKGKVVMTISMSEQSAKAIEIFSEALNMKKSEFIEDVCMTFIQDVSRKQAQIRKEAKAKEKAKQKKGRA